LIGSILGLFIVVKRGAGALSSIAWNAVAALLWISILIEGLKWLP